MSFGRSSPRTMGGSWFVAGKFDQYRRDQEFDAVRQAFRSLGRLLLAEPEEAGSGQYPVDWLLTSVTVQRPSCRVKLISPAASTG
ncbi:MAG TPA: hypothetical protein VFC19_50075 [Candidatus Limnocylindrales bacterium]|nr:hypothetical protein [Candidatus Limnocylindrales bacterium]